MKVAVFPSDDGGCGWYRLRWPALALAAEGHDVQIEPALGYYRDLEHEEPARLFLDADVVVVQRIVNLTGLEFVAALKEHGHRVIVDVDDDLDALPDGHPYRREVDGTVADRHGLVLHEVCQLADVVTCSTAPLLDRYGYGKGVLLPNLVPAAYLRLRGRRSGRRRVGWTGRPISHIDDARLLRGVGSAAVDAGWAFAAWGQSAPETFRQAGVPVSAQVTVPHRPLRSGFPGSVAELSLGLVPLQDSPFNRAKSWLKGLEYAALGVPFVASDLPEYSRLAELGAGVVVSDDGWADTVAEMLPDEDRRAELAESGRMVASALTYEAHAGRWLDAWTGGPHEDHGSCATIIPPVEGHASPALVDSL